MSTTPGRRPGTPAAPSRSRSECARTGRATRAPSQARGSPWPGSDERRMDLGDRVWPEGPPATVLGPLGALEQHGPHLPLDTDARVATAIARRAAADDSALLVAPPLAYGASGEHEGF